MKNIKLFENFDQRETEPNEVVPYFYDWKETVPQKDKESMRNDAKITGGYYEELPVSSADSKIFASGPESFFEWYYANVDDVADGCAHIMFMDYSSRYDENEDPVEEVEKYFMKDDEMYVKTDKGNEYNFHDWVDKINKDQE